MVPMRSMTMSISCPSIKFKELELIITENCVIFPKSLIGATIQDGGKRERRNECYTNSNPKFKIR